MKIFIIFLIFLLNFTYAQDEEDFDLEDGAPKKEKVTFTVSAESLQKLLRSGEYTKLKDSFEKLVNAKDEKLKDVAIRKVQISWQIETGQYKKAVEQLTKSPLKDDEDCYFLASEAYRLVGEYDKALKLVEEGLGKFPKSAPLLYAGSNLSKIKGNDQGESNYWSKIKSLYREISKRDEDNKRVGTAKQMAFVGLGARVRSPQTAYSLFQRAYKKDPNFVNAYVWAGFHCADKYAWNFALEEFSKAMKANPNHALTNAGLAYVLMEKGDYKKARELIQAALKTNPNCSEAIQLEAAILIADEKNRQAMTLLKKALEINPNDLEVLSQVAAGYEQNSNKEKRDEFIAKVLKINPKYGQVYLAIAQSCENRRQFPAAVEWSKKAIEMDSRDWEGYYVAGMNLLRLGEESEGYKTLDKAFKYNSFNIWARNILVLLDRDFKKKQYKQFETEHFVIKLHRSESEIMYPYLEEVVEHAWDKYTKRYGIEPVGPKEYDGKILLLMFHEHNDFSARTVGLPGLGALGACFGQIITMPSPIMGKEDDRRKFNWKRVFEHEFVHVLTLQKSSYNIPRWFTEGISTWEEEDPQSEVDRQLKWAWKNDRLMSLEDINSGFSQQSYPNQIGVSYYHASLVCKYINDKYGYEAIQKMLQLFRDGKGNEEAIEGGTGRKMSEINKEVKEYVDAYVKKIPISVPMDKKIMAELESTLKSFGLKDDRQLDLAAAYVQHGETEKGEGLIDKLLTKMPDNPRANAIKAFIFYQKDEKDEAAEYFKKVLKAEPTNYGANYILGQMAEEKDKEEEAVEYYQNALKHYPRVENPANNLYFKIVTLLDKMGKKDAALEALRLHTVNNNKNFDGFVRYAKRLQQEGKNKEAIESYMNANFIYPFDNDVHLECGRLMTREKMYKEAAREFGVALELDPRSKSILKNLFDLSLLLKDKQKAENTLGVLKRFHPDEDISELEKKLSELK